ncbi:hypothetical protein [Cysteiniphilum sp. 6C5]|uniref:hypothetical protein n=1 Tax=unclassified Cysteiniphilum TaxID=2610889 RepID=UPI003F85C31A
MTEFKLKDILNKEGMDFYKNFSSESKNEDDQALLYKQLQNVESGNVNENDLNDLLSQLYSEGWLHNNFTNVEWLEKNYNDGAWMEAVKPLSDDSNIISNNSNTKSLYHSLEKNINNISSENKNPFNENINTSGSQIFSKIKKNYDDSSIKERTSSLNQDINDLNINRTSINNSDSKANNRYEYSQNHDDYDNVNISTTDINVINSNAYQKNNSNEINNESKLSNDKRNLNDSLNTSNQSQQELSHQNNQSSEDSISKNEKTLKKIQGYVAKAEKGTKKHSLLTALAAEYPRVMVEQFSFKHLVSSKRGSERQNKLDAIERMADATYDNELINTNDLAVLYRGGSDARKNIGNKIGIGGDSYRNVYSLAESYQVETHLNKKHNSDFSFNDIEKDLKHDNYQKKLLETVKWAYEKDIRKQFAIESKKSLEDKGFDKKADLDTKVISEQKNNLDGLKINNSRNDNISSTDLSQKYNSSNQLSDSQSGRDNGNIFTQLADKIANKQEISDKDKEDLYAKYPERTEALYLKKNLDKQVDNYNKYSINYQKKYKNELGKQRDRIAETDAGGIGFLTKNNIAYQRVQKLQQLIKDVASYNISNGDASKSLFESVVSEYKLNEKQTHWSANNTTTYNNLKKPLTDFLNKSYDAREELKFEERYVQLTSKYSKEELNINFNRDDAIKELENNDKDLSDAKNTLIKTIEAEITRLKETSSYQQAEAKIQAIDKGISELGRYNTNIASDTLNKIQQRRYADDNVVTKTVGGLASGISALTNNLFGKASTTAGASISGYVNAHSVKEVSYENE